MPMSKKQFLDEYKPFHWAYEFFEVFNGDEKGFDIIIGNPPYIQLQRKEMISENVRKAYELKKYDTFKKTGDIYCLFYERSLDLLKENGKLCYITSNKWMRAGYGDKLRELLSKYNTDILIDFAGLKNFKAATVDTNIILISKKPNMNDGIAVKIKDDFDEQNGLEEYVHKNMIPLRDMSKEAWFIGTKEEHALKKKIEETGKPLKEWDVEIYRGILTGYNKAFIIDEKTKNKLIRKDPNSADIIKPILRGRDIKRYRYEFADIYLINTHNEYKRSNGKIIPEIKIEKYPAIKKHLDKHWEKISKRHDKGKTPYNLRNCTYLEEFEKENIAIKAVGKNLAFSIVEEGVYVTAPASIITSKYNKYMLGMLCSNYSRYFIYEYSDRTGAGDIMLNIQSIEKLPIPEPTDDNKKIISAIEQKVNAILEKKKQDQTADTKKLEEQIDLLVYIIFDLDYEMVKTIDPEFPLKKNIYLQKKAKLTR
jgi:adenine-specific DNA-methyltransferase